MKQWKIENFAKVYNALVFSSQYAREALDNIQTGHFSGAQIGLAELAGMADAGAQILQATLTIDEAQTLETMPENLEILNDATENYTLNAPAPGKEYEQDLYEKTGGGLFPDLVNDPTRTADD